MARDYKLNKSELTRLKRQEKLYEHYLPVLKLKQEQLQIEYNRIRKHVDEERVKSHELETKLKPYAPCFSDPHAPILSAIVMVDEIHTISKSIAGITIKTFGSVRFKDVALPYFHTQPWVIRVQPILQAYVSSQIRLLLLLEEQTIIKRELKKATQKVNLFDMVLIPETKEAIKRIKVALGDEQVASVSRGKIAKGKKMLSTAVLEFI